MLPCVYADTPWFSARKATLTIPHLKRTATCGSSGELLRRHRKRGSRCGESNPRLKLQRLHCRHGSPESGDGRVLRTGRSAQTEGERSTSPKVRGRTPTPIVKVQRENKFPRSGARNRTKIHRVRVCCPTFGRHPNESRRKRSKKDGGLGGIRTPTDRVRAGYAAVTSRALGGVVAAVDSMGVQPTTFRVKAGYASVASRVQIVAAFGSHGGADSFCLTPRTSSLPPWSKSERS